LNWGLKDAGVVDAYSARWNDAWHVAFAPAVAVGVDGQAKRVIPLVDGAADMSSTQASVAANIK